MKLLTVPSGLDLLNGRIAALAGRYRRPNILADDSGARQTDT